MSFPAKLQSMVASLFRPQQPKEFAPIIPKEGIFQNFLHVTAQVEENDDQPQQTILSADFSWVHTPEDIGLAKEQLGRVLDQLGIEHQLEETSSDFGDKSIGHADGVGSIYASVSATFDTQSAAKLKEIKQTVEGRFTSLKAAALKAQQPEAASCIPG